MLPLLGTDNGYIFLRDPTAGWQQVFATGSHGLEDDILYSLVPTPAAVANVWCYDYSTNVPLVSQDGGQSWVPGSRLTFAPLLLFCKDEQGRLFNGNYYQGIIRSSDQGATWTPVVPHAWPLSLWVSDGYIWWILRSDAHLYRSDYEGNGQTAFDGGMTAYDTFLLRGFYRSGRLYVYSSSNTAPDGTIPPITSIDVSDPTSPVFTNVPNPFGSTRFVNYI